MTLTTTIREENSRSTTAQKPSTIDRPRRIRLAWDIWHTPRKGSSAIAQTQQKRLCDLVDYARLHSPLYRRLYEHVPRQIEDITSLPPVTKSQLMANFDESVTDPTIKYDDVSAFSNDESLVDHYYQRRYSVWKTSGTSGRQGHLVHDPWARAVYNTLALRGWSGWTYPSRVSVLHKVLRQGVRTAFVLATEGHYASTAQWHRELRQDPDVAKGLLLIDISAPISDMVAQLNHFQPSIMTTYATMAVVLARQQQLERLNIKPIFVITSGEALNDGMRAEIEAIFGCPVRDNYGASEFLGIAHDCGRGSLHVNADWAILEPIDRDNQPVSSGETSPSVLLTHLANRVQPLIRYDLGDRICVRSEPCPCGSPLPAIRVEGRNNEILSLPNDHGQHVDVIPFTLTTPVFETPGVCMYQVIQTEPGRLSIRLSVKQGWDEQVVWQDVRNRLSETLSQFEINGIEIVRSPTPPKPTDSGKMPEVWSEC